MVYDYEYVYSMWFEWEMETQTLEYVNKFAKIIKYELSSSGYWPVLRISFKDIILKELALIMLKSGVSHDFVTMIFELLFEDIEYMYTNEDTLENKIYTMRKNYKFWDCRWDNISYLLKETDFLKSDLWFEVLGYRWWYENIHELWLPLRSWFIEKRTTTQKRDYVLFCIVYLGMDLALYVWWEDDVRIIDMWKFKSYDDLYWWFLYNIKDSVNNFIKFMIESSDDFGLFCKTVTEGKEKNKNYTREETIELIKSFITPFNISDIEVTGYVNDNAEHNEMRKKFWTGEIVEMRRNGKTVWYRVKNKLKFKK